MRLSIVIPAYNEEKTILEVLEKLKKCKMDASKEIIIVDDGSTDKSAELIKSYFSKNKGLKDIKYKFISKANGGKGSAVRAGVKIAKGDVLIIQDADLEYDPEDYNKLIKEIKKGHSVVYGSRFLKNHKPLYKIYFYGNKFLTLVTKILYNSKITDMETCYKMFKIDLIKSIRIESNGFEIEPEITAKILKRGIKIKEVPINYNPRSVSEGKKIGWKDGMKAIWTLLYWRLKK